MIHAIAAALLFAALPAVAEVPTWCRYIQPGTALYRQHCTPPPPAVGLTCDGTPAQQITVENFCAGWTVWAKADGIVVVCPGRQPPAGYTRLRSDQ